MHRIDTATRAVDLFGPGKHGFKNGNPLSGDPATALNAEWFNAVQEEIANVIEGASAALDPETNGQLLSAINTLIAAATTVYVNRAGDTLTGMLSGPGGAYGIHPGRGAFNARGNGNAVIFGHTNPEYACAIGALSGGGAPFLSFWCTHGEGPNEMVRSSSTAVPSRLIVSGNGDVLFQMAAVGPAGSIIAASDWTTLGHLVPASDIEIQIGTDRTRMVTPAGLASLTATGNRRGLVELATNAETQAGTDTVRAVTPAGLASLTATETRSGLVELATAAETIAGIDATRAVTPAGLGMAARSLSTNGYQRLPGGLIIQWGNVAGAPGGGAQTTLTLPTTFTTTMLTGVVSANSTTSTNITVLTFTKSSFVVVNHAPGPVNIFFIAMGW